MKRLKPAEVLAVRLTQLLDGRVAREVQEWDVIFPRGGARPEASRNGNARWEAWVPCAGSESLRIHLYSFDSVTACARCPSEKLRIEWDEHLTAEVFIREGGPDDA